MTGSSETTTYLPRFVAATLLLLAGGGLKAQDMSSRTSEKDSQLLDREFRLLEVPGVTRRMVPSHQTDLRNLAKSWNRLAADVRTAQIHFSEDENLALDAILMQIQTGLIGMGLVNPAGTHAVNEHRVLQQLLPNTSGLKEFLKRKSEQNPKVADFRRLAADANGLSEITGRLAPLVPLHLLER